MIQKSALNIQSLLSFNATAKMPIFRKRNTQTMEQKKSLKSASLTPSVSFAVAYIYKLNPKNAKLHDL